MEIRIKSDGGKIDLDQVDVVETITGTIKGVLADDSITNKIEHGESNIPASSSGGEKNIQIGTS